MIAARRLTVALIILLVLLAPWGKASAQTPDELLYFPETGHNVKGKFLQFYKSIANPELLYGKPITEQFTSTDGKTVQYFQRSRFEWDGETPASVQPTPLGRLTYEPSSQKLDINNPAACKLFPTGFHVCFAFLDFYEANGGQEQFGDPISTFEFQENLIVQYFERARFEWRADRPEGERVVLTDLGRIYFDQIGEDQSYLKSLRLLDATISPVLSISARAFVGNAITLSSGQQTVNIVVRSQTRQPVSNATGKVTVHFPEQQSVEYYFTTNASGLGSATFNFEDQKQGELVQIEIIVAYQGLSAKTTTSYRIWY